MEMEEVQPYFCMGCHRQVDEGDNYCSEECELKYQEIMRWEMEPDSYDKQNEINDISTNGKLVAEDIEQSLERIRGDLAEALACIILKTALDKVSEEYRNDR